MIKRFHEMQANLLVVENSSEREGCNINARPLSGGQLEEMGVFRTSMGQGMNG